MDPFQMSPENKWQVMQFLQSRMRRDQLQQREAPKVHWGSDEGKRLRALSDEKKNRATAALKDGNLEIAQALYGEALSAAVEVMNNEEQVGVLFSNISHVHFKMGHHENALIFAERAVSVRPLWFKGHVRKIRAMSGLKKYDDAFDHGLQMSMCWGQMSYVEMLQIFENVVVLLPKVSDPHAIKRAAVSHGVWSDTIKNLAKNNEWEAISVLLLGRDHFEPLVNLKNIQFPVKELELSGLLKASSVSDTDWKSWGERLAVKLVQEGARIDSMDPGGKYGLHAAFGVGLRTGTFNLAKHLFLHKIPMSDRNRTDQEGNTLLHLACRSDSPKMVEAVKFLLEHNLDPTCRNKHGKKPVDFLTTTSPDWHKILDIMKDKGFEISSVTSPESSKKMPSLSSKSASDLVGLPSAAETETRHMPSSTTTTVSCDSSSNINSISASGKVREVEQWNTKEVEHWASNHGIKAIINRLNILDGNLLVELKNIQHTSPTTFFAMLHENMKLSCAEILRMSSAIRKLGL